MDNTPILLFFLLFHDSPIEFGVHPMASSRASRQASEPCLLRRPYLTATGSMCQIFSAYSLIVRSLENLPMPATLRMAFLAHSSGLL